ncbi:hypothetical protein JYU34_010646 [Plutella xylostella]|uniref:Uncharacterized protein n=1 Tax=Plutella xylostella TaxID=51655 RepID=A0ABQ7QIX4_PLUXY|nr:hypothetical protein JYU34_010646 [Plutella xylostella]
MHWLHLSKNRSTPVSYATPATGGAPPPPPLLLHPAALQHWALDPFCPHRLMVACDDGSLNQWTIPEFLPFFR